MRKAIPLAMIAASVVLIALAAWLLLRPNAGSSGADSAQPPPITPDLASLAIPKPAAQTPQLRALAATPRSAAPAAVSPVAERAPAEEGVKRILPEELQRRLDGPNPPLVWELRSPDRYEKEHIPGSKLVKLPEVTALAEGLDRSQAIITNCD